MELSITELLGAPLIVALRVSGLMLFAPFFGNVSIPIRVKVVLVLAITAALYPVYSARVGIVPMQDWPQVVLRETLVGIAIGICTNFVFEAVSLAGHVLGVQMGYSLVSILDPQTQAESSVVALFHQTVALIIFLQLNVHHWILRGIGRSFDYMAPGHFRVNASLMTNLLSGCAGVFSTALQLAAPVLAATILADIVLGFLGKASPQMPVMLMGPALKSMLGVGILMASVHYWPNFFEKHFSDSIQFTERLLELAAR
jgi:flagellar biosynthetic protein FliR